MEDREGTMSPNGFILCFKWHLEQAGITDFILILISQL